MLLIILVLIAFDFPIALIYAIIKKTIKKDKDEKSFMYYFGVGTFAVFRLFVESWF